MPVFGHIQGWKIIFVLRAHTACQENFPANTLVHNYWKSFHLGNLFSVYKYVQTNCFCMYKELKLRSLVTYFHIRVRSRQAVLCMHLAVVGDRGREPGKMRAGSGHKTGGDGAGCSSRARAGDGKRMRNVEKVFY